MHLVVVVVVARAKCWIAQSEYVRVERKGIPARIEIVRGNSQAIIGVVP